MGKQKQMEYILSLFGLPQADIKKADSFARRLFFHIHDHFIPHHRNNYHPHILGHRSLALFSALLLSVKIFTFGVLTFGPVVPAFSSAITTDNIVALTNQSRQANGIKGLLYNSKLALAAQSKAEDMLAKGYFAHNTPDNKTPWSFISAAGYSYITAGENLAVNFAEAEDVEEAWMNSPGHRANILNQSFEEIGIGIAQGMYQSKNAIFVVQMFGTASAPEQNVVLSESPTALVAAGLQMPEAAAAEPTVLTENKPEAASPIKSETSKAEPQKLVGNKEPATVTQAPLELKFAQVSLSQLSDAVKLNAEVEGQAVKVMAKYGRAAVMLTPKAEGIWEGEIDLNKLTGSGAKLVLEARDMDGKVVSSEVASFAGSTLGSFKLAPQSSENLGQVSIFGKIFNPSGFEQQFYLVFIAVLLACLIMAIAIKRHVQHVSLIANTSLVIVLAVGLWLR